MTPVGASSREFGGGLGSAVERGLTLRLVTWLMSAVIALTFLFGFGNVWALAVRLGVPLWVAPLVAPAVDLSVMALLLATRYDGCDPPPLRRLGDDPAAGAVQLRGRRVAAGVGGEDERGCGRLTRHRGVVLPIDLGHGRRGDLDGDLRPTTARPGLAVQPGCAGLDETGTGFGETGQKLRSLLPAAPVSAIRAPADRRRAPVLVNMDFASARVTPAELNIRCREWRTG
jgi:hypothetical protein